jgi:hypothetical protein
MLASRSSRVIAVLLLLIVGLHGGCSALYLVSDGRGGVPDAPTLYHAPLVLGMLGAILALLVALPLSLRSTAGAGSRGLALLSAAWIACTLLTVQLTPDRRRQAIEEIARRGDGLAQAIAGYQQQHGKPPATLEDLAPGPLARLTEFGVPAHLVQYRTPPEGEAWPAPGWQLHVVLPRSGFIASADILYYHPAGSGAPGPARQGRRIGDWVLVLD